MGIGVIGAGRVGAVLGSALRAQGHAITGAYAVSDASRERAELLLPNVPILGVPAIVERSEVVLLAVPDDQLADLAQGIAAAGLVPGGQIVVHTSGRYGIDVLAPIERAGAAVLAVHPAMTFTGTSIDLPRLQGCPMAVTARTAFLPIAQALALEIGGNPMPIAEADRPLYHAALGHGANHLTVLVAQARAMLQRLGVEDAGAMLAPLMHAALDEALSRGFDALTGPISRGDAGTVAAHRIALAELAAQNPAEPGSTDDPQAIAETYLAMARAAADAARAHGRIGPQAHAAIIETLTGSPHESAVTERPPGGVEDR
nr:DUF2520 domain-containing protein [Devriesea agamarum]